MTLKGRRVLVLGGSSGIGLAVARAALEAGAEIGIVSSNRERVDEALSDLRHDGVGYTADLANDEAIRDLFQRVGAFDHLVFTAGDTIPQRFLDEVSLADARRFFDVRFWEGFWRPSTVMA